MSDAFSTPLRPAEEVRFEKFLNAVTNPTARQQLKACANGDTWSPETESFSGLFGYVCGDFVQRYLLRDGDYLEEYPVDWVKVQRDRIDVTLSEAARFFQDGNSQIKKCTDVARVDDNTKFAGRSVYQAISQGPAKKYREERDPRLFGVVGILLGIDMGLGEKGRCFAEVDVELEDIENKARRLRVTVEGQRCPDEFVASVLALYAKKVCRCRVLGKKVPCPHCGMQKPDKQPCPHCGIVGDSWICPDCRTRTDVTKLPNHGTTGMYCPTDGCHLPVVRGGELLEIFRTASQKPLAAALDELRALQRECLGISAELSWTRLVDQIARLEAASTALGRIDTAVEAKNIHDADEALRAAKSEYPDLDYTRFDRRIAALKVSAAEREIQGLLDAGKIDEASGKMEEASGISGFDANKWRGKIREKRAERERQRKIEDKKREFDAAWGNQEWEKAKRIGRELAELGEKSESYWNGEIERHKQSLKQDLGKTRDDALAAFSEALGRDDVLKARAELGKAKAAQEKLHAQFGGSVTVPRIAEGERKLAELEKRVALEGLRPVRELTASGSTDGKPTITISWKPGVGGTQVSKWRIWRREKGSSGKGVKVEELNASTTSYADRGTGLKVGVEYEYGVVPMAELDKTCRENEKAIVWSQPAVCLVRLPNDALSGTGQGMDGAGGIVTLQWKLPDGLPGGVPHRFLLSRGDGKFSGKDVTAFNGIFEDGDVSVGTTFDYSLRFKLCGRDMGTAKASVSVRKVQPPTPVGKFSFKRSAQGTVLVCWVWPEGLDSCLWGVADREATRPADIPKTAQRRVSRTVFDEKGGVTPAMPPGGAPCWLSVFGIRSFGDREFFSAGRSVPLRETVLEYSLETNPGGLFSKRKPAFLTIRSSTGYIPDLEVRSGKNRTEVLSRRGGRIALAVAQESSTPEKRIALDGTVSPGEFLRVYLAHPDAENCKLKHPPEFEVK